MVVHLSLSSQVQNKQLLFHTNISKARQQVACLFCINTHLPWYECKNGVFSNSDYTKAKKHNLFRKRAGIEPVIGHCKNDHRLGRNFYKGLFGDSINVMLAAAAFDLKRGMGALWTLVQIGFFRSSASLKVSLRARQVSYTHVRELFKGRLFIVSSLRFVATRSVAYLCISECSSTLI